MVDTPSRPNQSFSELGAGLSPQSPVTPGLQAVPLEPSKLSQDSIQTSTDSSPDGMDGIYDEAGALYYIQQLEPGSLDDAHPQPMPEGDDEDLNFRREVIQIMQPTVAPLRPKTTSPHPPPPPSPGRSLPSIDTSHRKPPIQPLPRTPTLDYGPDRRPAGARAAPVSNRQDTVTSSSSHLSRNFSMPTSGITQYASTSQSGDLGEDALAALTFVERHEDDVPVVPAPPPVASPPTHIPQETPAIIEPDIRPQTPDSENASVYKSSFAPSKNAMQRKARSEAQQAAHEAATHRPGHGKGKAKDKGKAVGTWDDSSEEEEEEEEEDDEDVDSDGEPVAPRDDRSVSNYAASINQRSRFSSPRGPSPLASGGDVSTAQPPPARPPRNLPPVPIPRGQGISLSLSIFGTLVLTILVQSMTETLPDLVVSSRSKEQEEGGPITKTVSPMGALLLRDRFPLTPPHPSPLVTCGVKSSTLVIPPALFQKTAILATHSFSWSLRHKP